MRHAVGFIASLAVLASAVTSSLAAPPAAVAFKVAMLACTGLGGAGVGYCLSRLRSASRAG